MSKSYTATDKLDAVERAISISRRAGPKLIAQGHLSRPVMWRYLDILSHVAADYRSQPIDAKKLTPSGSSVLDSMGESTSFDTS